MKHLPYDIQAEIFRSALLRHPFVIKSDNIRSYILMNQIIDMLESDSGFKDFADIYEDDINIQEIDKVHYEVRVPNRRFKPTSPHCFENAPYSKYLFFVGTMDEIREDARSHLSDSITGICPSILYQAHLGTVCEPTKQSEMVFDNSTCPVCLEDYSDTIVKQVSLCGHCLCLECFESIKKRSPAKCPECRKQWSYQKVYTEDELYELAVNGETDRLIDLVDEEVLLDLMVEDDNFKLMVGCEEEYTFEDDIPSKYNNRTDFDIVPLGVNIFIAKY